MIDTFQEFLRKGLDSSTPTHHRLLFWIVLLGVPYWLIYVIKRGLKRLKGNVREVETESEFQDNKSETVLSDQSPVSASKKSPSFKRTPQRKQKESVPNRFKDCYISDLKIPRSAVVNSVCVDHTGHHICVACSDATLHYINVIFNDDDQKLKPNSFSFSRPLTHKLEARDDLIAIDFDNVGNSIFGVLGYRTNLVRISVTPLENRFKCMMKSDMTLSKHNIDWMCSSKGMWIATWSKDETAVNFWSYELELLARYDTKQIQNYYMATSPISGRFLGAACWTSGIKVMEVKAKSGEFFKLERAMDLSTRCGSLAFSFSPDDTRAAVATKNKEIVVFDTSVLYSLGEDAKIIKDKKIKSLNAVEHLSFDDGDIDKDSASSSFDAIRAMSYSRDGKRIFIFHGKSITVFDALSLDVLSIMNDIHLSPMRAISLPTSENAPYVITLSQSERPTLWLL